MKKRLLCMRLISLGLTFVLLASALAACTTSEFELDLESLEGLLKPSDPSEESQSTKDPEASSPEEVETTPPCIIVCPGGIRDDLSFQREVRILGWEEGKHNYWGEKESENVIELSLYNRNTTVEDRLGVELVWEFVPGSEMNREQFIEAMTVASETDPYDAVMCRSMIPYYMAAKGLTADLSDTSYLDLTARWWPEAFIEQNMINGQIYSLVEDNDLGLLRNMSVIFFENDLLEKKGIESPYHLVEINEWTIDKLSQLIKDTYEDLNGNGDADVEDRYGFSNASIVKSDAWFYALGYRETDVRDEKLVSYLNGDGFSQYIDKMISFYDIEDVFSTDFVQLEMFKEKRVYFYSGAVQFSELFLENMQDDLLNYGVAPMPKLNAEQSRYYTYVGTLHNMWCVPAGVKDMDCSSAVLECMASESYRQVGPVYYDTCVKLRYAPDERLATMYDLIRESTVFDVGRFYSQVLCGSQVPRFLMRSCISKPEKYTWQTQYLSYKNEWSDAFDQMVAIYSK